MAGYNVPKSKKRADGESNGAPNPHYRSVTTRSLRGTLFSSATTAVHVDLPGASVELSRVWNFGRHPNGF
jgi:hypothetical protein